MTALIAFIESHDGCRVECLSVSGLLVSSLVVLPDGSLRRQEDIILANWSAARDWLGY